MILHCGLLLMFMSCVRTTEYLYDYGMNNAVNEFEQRYSYWPSMHNALVKLQKREADSDAHTINEGGGSVPIASIPNNSSIPNPQSNSSYPSNASITSNPHQSSSSATTQQFAAHPTVAGGKTTLKQNNEPSSSTEPSILGNKTLSTIEQSMTTRNITQALPKQFDLHNPGVMMRGVIVFGGFLLLAVAYYIFYRKKSNNNDVGNSHSINDANQFRYGVLQSDDRRDNLELSRVPLTMDSDDDDDEDLEIFDLGQKKKSLSYVNLQTNDEDIVFPTSRESEADKDNLLLDIEDASTDTLINWSSNDNNKSIL